MKNERSSLLQQALTDHNNPLFPELSFRLALMVDARSRGDHYEAALQHQKISELLDRYADASARHDESGETR